MKEKRLREAVERHELRLKKRKEEEMAHKVAMEKRRKQQEEDTKKKLLDSLRIQKQLKDENDRMMKKMLALQRE